MTKTVNEVLEKKRADFCDVLGLMARDPVYRRWTVSDIRRIVARPIELGQYIIYRAEDGRPVTFVTWAWLTQEAARAFIDGTRLLQPEDLNAGDELWFLDIVGKNGRMRAIVRDLQNRFRGAKGGYHIRHRSKGVVRGKHGRKVDYVGG